MESITTEIISLLDDLKSSNLPIKLAAYKQITKIASVIGTQRTIDELLPFIFESLEEEDSACVAELARQLGILADVKSDIELVVVIFDRLIEVIRFDDREGNEAAIVTLFDLLTRNDFSKLEPQLTKIVGEFLNSPIPFQSEFAHQTIIEIFPLVDSNIQAQYIKLKFKQKPPFFRYRG